MEPISAPIPGRKNVGKYRGEKLETGDQKKKGKGFLQAAGAMGDDRIQTRENLQRGERVPEGLKRRGGVGKSEGQGQALFGLSLQREAKLRLG